MSLYRKKPVVIEAITFDELVAHGLAAPGANIVDGMPWSFTYKGHGITHENDDCYLIPTLEGTMRFERGGMLIAGVAGEIYPCKREIFDATYQEAQLGNWSEIPGTAAHRSVISDTCRQNHTDDGAFWEAVRRMKREYDALCEGWEIGRGAKMHVTLTIEREVKP